MERMNMIMGSATIAVVIVGLAWLYAEWYKTESNRLKTVRQLNHTYLGNRLRTRSIKPKSDINRRPKTTQNKRPKRNLRTRSIKPRSGWGKQYIKGLSNSPHFKRLTGLTRSEEISKRMVQHAAERNPGRSEQWCIEKAIYDIERDRMAR